MHQGQNMTCSCALKCQDIIRFSLSRDAIKVGKLLQDTSSQSWSPPLSFMVLDRTVVVHRRISEEGSGSQAPTPVTHSAAGATCQPRQFLANRPATRSKISTNPAESGKRSRNNSYMRHVSPPQSSSPTHRDCQLKPNCCPTNPSSS